MQLVEAATKKSKKGVARRVFADLGTGNAMDGPRQHHPLSKATKTKSKKSVAKPDPMLKIRRDVRNAASGKDEGFRRNSKGENNSESVGRRNDAAGRRPSGGRIHRAAAEEFNLPYQAEGNRFIMNDDL